MTNSPAIPAHAISLRDFCETDIPLILDYWFRSPPEFFENLGVDWKKMPSEEEMKTNLLKKIDLNKTCEPSRLTVLTISVNNQPVGAHTLNPLLENDYGIFHAHIWNSAYRRLGIAFHTYPRACQIFMKRFALKRILFKTPLGNIGAIRVKEKLGIRQIGEETISFSIIKEGTRAKVFEVTPSEIDQLIATNPSRA